MKKRILSCLAVLLLMAMLLCSCAEGLPLSELYFAAKNTAASYTAKIKLLQSGAKTIAENKTSEYAISFDTTSSKEVKDAVTALAVRIKKQTGADLLDEKREGVTKRIVIGFPKKNETPLVDGAAQFYVGFSGEDLIIQAHNDVMLISAIRYFEENFLSDEEKPLILSPDLSYLSPTATYRTKEHALIRAEKTGNTAKEAASALCETLFEKTGVRFTVKSDFNAGGGLTDILFGYPDDDEAQKILSTLGFDDYYIGVRNGRLMILAKNDPALADATECFLSSFVTAENAVFDKTEKTVTLPAVCDYYYRSDAILMAEEGINCAVLVYAANANSATKNAAATFAELYKRLTNTEIPIHKDSDFAPRAGSFEILVGETNRELTNHIRMESLLDGQWAISVLPENNCISVLAKGNIAILAAMNHLGKKLTEQAAAIDKTQAEGYPYLPAGTNRLLYVKTDLALTGLEPLDFPVAYECRFFQNSYRITSAAQVSERAWTYYNRALTNRASFIRLSQSEKDGIVTTTFQSETRSLTLTYNKNKKSMELRVSPYVAR